MQNLNIPYPLQIFAIGNDHRLASKIIEELEMRPADMIIKDFSDGESIPHQLETVRGRDVFIIMTSQNGPKTGHWLMQYLRFVWSIKAGDPYKITAIIPKLPHQRQDVEDRDSRQTTMSDFFPTLLQSAGVDRIVVCKLHNPASRTKNPPMENIDTTALIIKERIIAKYPDLSKLAIAAGDMGGSKYARKVSNELGVPLIIADKNRDKNKSDESEVMKVYTEGEISPEIDSVEFVDDLISTFKTLKNAGNAIHTEYPQIKKYGAVVTHPDFGESTLGHIIESRFESICVTDTVPVSDEFIEKAKLAGKEVSVVSVKTLIARTIDNMHNGKSVSALWTKNGSNKLATSNS